jgi:hypothetical protein
MSYEYEFEILQGDQWTAGGSAADLESCVREAEHYAFMYGQDGPVEVRYYRVMRERIVDL